MVMVDRTHDMAPKHSTVKTIPLFVAYKWQKSRNRDSRSGKCIFETFPNVTVLHCETVAELRFCEKGPSLLSRLLDLPMPCVKKTTDWSSSSSSSSRNEYYLGGIIALLLQDHRTMSTKYGAEASHIVAASIHGDRSALSDERADSLQY